MDRARTLRIHVTGAAGAGSSTVGRALAARLGMPWYDSDDYYWAPTEIPFTAIRPIEERLQLMECDFLDQSGFVLSGSVAEWDAGLEDRFDLVVFLRAPRELRLERLRARETQRHGPEALEEGGARWLAMEAFLACAGRYDEAGFRGRSLARHRAWLSRLSCPVIESDGARPLEAQLARILDAAALDAAGAPA